MMLTSSPFKHNDQEEIPHNLLSSIQTILLSIDPVLTVTQKQQNTYFNKEKLM